MLTEFNAEYGEPSPPLPELTERFRLLLGSSRFWAIVASADDGVPVGFATLAERDSAYYARGAVYLEDLYVVPRLRGQALGAAMVQLMIAESHRRGIGLVEVGVDEPDVDALRFYEREGFVHRDPGSGDRAFHLQMELEG